MSAGNIYNAQQTFKELFRKLAKVKTQSGRDLMCFGLWQLKYHFQPVVQTLAQDYVKVLIFTLFQMLKPTSFHSITN